MSIMLAPPQQQALPTLREAGELEYRPIEEGIDAKQVAEEVAKQYDESHRFLLPYFERWLRFYRMFRSFVPDKTRPWRANVFVPIPFANTEHGLATMMDAYFSSPPMTKVFPREGNDYANARTMEGYLSWEDDDMSVFLSYHETTKELLLYGTGFTKVYWDWGNNRNQIDSVSVFNLFPDPYCETLDDAEWVIHRSLRSPWYVKRMIALGAYEFDANKVDQLAEEGLAWTTEGDRLLSEVGLDTRNTRRRIEVLEAWTIDGQLRTVLNRRETVRARRGRSFPHPYYPFARHVDHTVPHELYGIGELEVIERLCAEINDMRNQRLDIVSQAINNVILADRGAGLDAQELVSRPGQIMWTNNMEGVKFLVQGGNTGLSTNEEQIARFDVQEATGNWGYNQGQVPQRRETATTVLALQRAAGVRFTSKVRWNEEAALKRTAYMRMANAQEFLTDERWIRITGQPVAQMMSRAHIQGKFDFVPAVSTAEPKEAKRAQVGQILPLMLQAQRIDDYELWDWILDLYNIKEKEKFLLSDDEMVQKALRAMQMAAIVQSGGAPGVGAGHSGLGAPGPGGMPTMIGAGGGPGQTPEMVEQVAPSDDEMGPARDAAAMALR